MSGIYIPGAELPESCFFCRAAEQIDPDTIRCRVNGKSFTATFVGTIETRNLGRCPLVFVPDHGRTIDVDAALQVIETRELRACLQSQDRKIAHTAIKILLNDALFPTVLPADKTTEEAETCGKR